MNKFSLRFFFVLLVTSLGLAVPETFGQQQPIKFNNGQATIILKDEVKHPFYWWPRTLLNYQIQVDKPITTSAFTLVESSSGQAVPFQLSEGQKNGQAQRVTLSFFSDLPSGGNKTFVLKAGKPAANSASVATRVEGKSILIQTDKLQVRIPASQTISGPVPGPVMQVAPVNQPAMGQSVLQAGTKQVQQIETEQLAGGPVFATYEITYTFKDGAKYIAQVKCIQDYDFIELEETMTGIKTEDKISWALNWSGFSPTHRQAPNHPYGQPGKNPGFARFDWETIGQTMMNSHHGIMTADKSGGKIPFEVGNYQAWPAERNVTSSVFWDEKKNLSVGAFLTDAGKWNDQDYAIWAPSGLLNIKFYYNNNLLSWQYPLSTGTRATAISCYPHQQDITYLEDLETKAKLQKHPLGFNVQTKMSQLSHNTFLQNRYGTIHLDKVKNWQLTYPEGAKLPAKIFEQGKLKSPEDFVRNFLSSSYIAELPFSGTRQNSGYGPVPAREFHEGWIDAFNRFYPSLNREQKERVTAMLLFHTYVAADEEYMPMRYMLSGHPNFLADVKSIPAFAAYQFPEHPQAARWSDLYEKYVELNTRYHSRPSVKTWQAQGGRWTENLGTYVWAFLRPTMRAAFLLKEAEGGKNRLAGPGVAAVGSWAMQALSAPYNGESLDFYRNKEGKLEMHFWGITTKNEGPRRVHPPQGAHSARRKPPASLWVLGSLLDRYDPLLAENLRYVAKPTDDDMEAMRSGKEAFDIMFPQTGYDTGTKPDLKSVKLTGYGTILRAGVDTPQELSVHLGQIDSGPNYRWGVAAQGGSGVIYFFAGGKSYSHNGREDAGDRKLQDTDLLTTFGVYKNGQFKSIGENVLHRPLYNLGLGQFTEVTSSETSAYAWPDYQSRSIMLVDKDYFITYDDVYNNNIGGRFSWFTHPEEDLPTLEVVKVGNARAGYQKTELKGAESKGVWFDMLGDCMVLVSHQKGFKISPAEYGAILTTPHQQTDYIFRTDKTIEAKEGDKIFAGTAGFIRIQPDQQQELALFHGQYIGTNLVKISATDTDAGISAKVNKAGYITGKFFSPRVATITFQWPEKAPKRLKFFLDGKQQTYPVQNNSLTVSFPAGEHAYQVTDGLPKPVRPRVISSENGAGQVKLYFTAAAGAQKYRIEQSQDNAATWQDLAETKQPFYVVKAKPGVKKMHVRVVALNQEHCSEASPAYPVYFTGEKPLAPDGLKADLHPNKITLNWGQVLGSSQYKLYRRLRGEEKYQLVYSGNRYSYEDKAIAKGQVYEYAVIAVNQNGESTKSYPVHTDADSWLHWDPKPGEKFRRTNSQSVPDKSLLYYPE